MGRRLANERRTAIACRIGFGRLVAEKNAGGSELMGRVLDLVSLWERQESCNPSYWERWRQRLAMPLDQAAAIVLADADEGAQLRHAHPFAAILTQDDRRMLRSTACSVEEGAVPMFRERGRLRLAKTRSSCEVISGINERSSKKGSEMGGRTVDEVIAALPARRRRRVERRYRELMAEVEAPGEKVADTPKDQAG